MMSRLASDESVGLEMNQSRICVMAAKKASFVRPLSHTLARQLDERASTSPPTALHTSRSPARSLLARCEVAGLAKPRLVDPRKLWVETALIKSFVHLAPKLHPQASTFPSEDVDRLATAAEALLTRLAH